MEKIAIISDIHGNLEALKVVLNDILEKGITKIFCLGDIIAKGSCDKECLRLIRKRCQVILKGNCESYFCNDENFNKAIKKEKSKLDFIWNKEKLSEEERNYLLNLPFCYEFYMSGSLIRLFHATPTKIDGCVSTIDNIRPKKEMFMPSENTVSKNVADIIIYGHTHVQTLEKIYNRTLINVGSVGNEINVIRNKDFDADPKETTQAHYLIIEGEYESKSYNSPLSFQFIRIPYDIEKELERNKDNPEKKAYINELKYGIYRDEEKLIKSFIQRGIDPEEF